MEFLKNGFHHSNLPQLHHLRISVFRSGRQALKEVDTSNRVYLTRNGHGEYGILTMAEIDELDRYKTAYTLFSKLQKAEERASEEGWIDADDLEKELGVN